MSSRIRLFSGISPCTGPWGYRHGGRGRRGGGLPPLLSLTPKLHNSRCRHPARAARSSPAPPRGLGQSWRYPVGSRGWGWRWWRFPRLSREERGDRPWGRRLAAGELAPSPVSILGFPRPDSIPAGCHPVEGGARVPDAPAGGRFNPFSVRGLSRPARGSRARWRRSASRGRGSPRSLRRCSTRRRSPCGCRRG